MSLGIGEHQRSNQLTVSSPVLALPATVGPMTKEKKQHLVLSSVLLVRGHHLTIIKGQLLGTL